MQTFILHIPCSLHRRHTHSVTRTRSWGQLALCGPAASPAGMWMGGMCPWYRCCSKHSLSNTSHLGADAACTWVFKKELDIRQLASLVSTFSRQWWPPTTTQTPSATIGHIIKNDPFLPDNIGPFSVSRQTLPTRLTSWGCVSSRTLAHCCRVCRPEGLCL